MLLGSQFVSKATPLPEYNVFTGKASVTPLLPQAEPESPSLSLHNDLVPDAGNDPSVPMVRGTYNPEIVSSRPEENELPGEEGAIVASAQYGLVRMARGKVSVATDDGEIPLNRLRDVALHSFSAPHNPLHTDMFSTSPTSSGEIALLYGEVLDENGAPKRWQWKTGSYDNDSFKECRLNRNTSLDSIVRLIRRVDVPFVFGNYRAQAAKYNQQVEVYAEKYNLSKALILAVMHTESNFNPYAVSRSNALGLMQVVPETAGEEAHRYLTGTRAVPSAQTLLTPEHNIRYGATYLHLLAKNYFGDITNHSSRQVCIIAAYNGGPGAVLRTFDADRETAIAKINALSADEVYKILTTRMPTAEARRYVEVVLSHYRNYAVSEPHLAQNAVSKNAKTL